MCPYLLLTVFKNFRFNITCCSKNWLHSFKNTGRKNQSWVLANHHAEAVDVNSKLSIRCLHCLKTISYTNYTSSPMISHLLRQHAITENSPASAENNGFANPLMNSDFACPQNITFSPEEWGSLTVD